MNETTIGHGPKSEGKEDTSLEEILSEQVNDWMRRSFNLLGQEGHAMQAPTPPKGESKLSRFMRPQKKSGRVTLTAICVVLYTTPILTHWSGAMTIARRQLVDLSVARWYHCATRCAPQRSLPACGGTNQP